MIIADKNDEYLNSLPPLEYEYRYMPNIVNNKIVTKEIPSVDIEVPYADTFLIEWQGDGFTITPNGSSYAISMSYSSDDLFPELKANASTWELVQYTGTHKKGIQLFSNVTQFVVDKTATLKPAVWSTESGYNRPLLLIPSLYSSAASIVWDDDTRTGEASFFEVQQIRIDWEIQNEAGSDSYSGIIYCDILPIEEGVYFVQNMKSNKYMQIERNSELGYNTAGNVMQSWNFDGGNYQKWRFEYNNNGYYKVISEKSGLALSAQSQSLNSGVPLLQETYNQSDYQQWQVTKTISGTYVFRPKSNLLNSDDWCISASYTTSINANGADIEQHIYTDNTDRRDEWILRKQKDYTLMYRGYEEGDPLMSPILNRVESQITSCNNVTGYSYTSLEKNDLKVHLSSTTVFSCITHGNSTGITVSNGGFTIDDINSLDDSAFNDLHFVVLGACYTAQGGSGADNFVNAMYNKGAGTVIGFKGGINIEEANAWNEYFMIEFAKGITLEEALSRADDKIQYEFGKSDFSLDKNNRVIMGSNQIRMFD